MIFALLWCRFDAWPGNFLMPWAWPKNKQTNKKTPKNKQKNLTIAHVVNVCAFLLPLESRGLLIGGVLFLLGICPM